MKKNIFLFLLLIFLIKLPSLSNQWQNTIVSKEIIHLLMHIYKNEELPIVPCLENIEIDLQSKILLNELLVTSIRNDFKNEMDIYKQASIACLLGLDHKALNLLTLGAMNGSEFQAILASLLYDKFGAESESLSILQKSIFNVNYIYNFYNLINYKSIKLDIYTIANYAVILDPQNELSWKILLSSCRYKQLNDELENLPLINSCYEYIIKSKPPLTNSDLSLIYLYMGETKRLLKSNYDSLQILTDYQKSIEYDPTNHWAYLLSSIVYLWDLNDIENASYFVMRSIDLEPDSAESYVVLGDIYLRMGNLDESLVAYENALTITPNLQIAIEKIKNLENSTKINN